jgi:HTH-type transcriptional repressor of NAD biosynthesis genes
MRGLVLGKFLPYHEGHAHLIRTARASVDELTVLVCSIAREPIPGGLRYQWVRESHPDCRVIHVSEELPQEPSEHADFWRIWSDVIARYAGNVDVVFTSEEYGDELARYLGATHVCVDRTRHTVPVSGTAIREATLRHWEHVPRVVRPHLALRVAIVGTESTGKTTLAERLAEKFGTVWVPEFGREYCLDRDARLLTQTDFESIAWAQAVAEEEYAARCSGVLICDTELHTTCTWSELIIGSCPSWIRAAATARRYDLILFLGHDSPWVNDGTRVLELRRVEHTRLLESALRTAGRTWTTLTGSFAEREAAAIRAVAALAESVTTRAVGRAAS